MHLMYNQQHQSKTPHETKIMNSTQKSKVNRFAQFFVKRPHMYALWAFIALSFALDHFSVLPEVSMVSRFIYTVIAFVAIICHAINYFDKKSNRVAS